MLEKMFPRGKEYKAFLKTDLSPDEVVGVKIVSEKGQK